jgi:hypothetical protein
VKCQKVGFFVSLGSVINILVPSGLFGNMQTKNHFLIMLTTIFGYLSICEEGLKCKRPYVTINAHIVGNIYKCQKWNEPKVVVHVKKKAVVKSDGSQIKVHVPKVHKHILMKLAYSMACKIFWIRTWDVGLWPNTISLRWKRTMILLCSLCLCLDPYDEWDLNQNNFICILEIKHIIGVIV